MDIQIDGVYVGGKGKSYLMRHVTGWAPGLDNVFWESYDARTGESTRDSGSCSKDHLSRWAGREATEEEVARMRKTGPTWQEEKSQKLVDNMIAAANQYRKLLSPQEHFQDIAEYMHREGSEQESGSITIDDYVYEFKVKRSPPRIV